MQKRLLIFLFIFPNLAFCQTIVKTNILYPLILTGTVIIEKPIRHNVGLSLQTAVGAGLAGWGDFGTMNNDKHRFQNLTAELRFFNREATSLSGFFVAPYIKYTHKRIRTEAVHLEHPVLPFSIGGRNFNGHALGLGTAIGYQEKTPKNLVFDFFSVWATTLTLYKPITATLLIVELAFLMFEQVYQSGINGNKRPMTRI